MTDAIIDPFQTTEPEVNPVDYAKAKFANANGELDVNALAKGKYESDQFIKTLERELEEERRKASQGLSYKELLEEIKRTNVSGEPTPAEREPVNPPTIDELSKLVKDTISQTANEQRETANKAKVVEKLNTEWGSNVSVELAKKSRELGISVKRLEEIGKESPEGLFAMLGLNVARQAPGSATVPTSRVTLPSNSSGDRTKSYYDKLYRENPAARHDPKVTGQEMRDATRLGAAFFDN